MHEKVGIGTQVRETSSLLSVKDSTHRIFTGSEITGGLMEMYSQDQDIDAVNTGGAVGDGVLLAETETNRYTALVVRDTPGLFNEGYPESHTARRDFFPLMRYFEDDGSGTISFGQYSETGLKLIANIIEYAIKGEVTGEPPTSIQEWAIY